MVEYLERNIEDFHNYNENSEIISIYQSSGEKETYIISENMKYGGYDMTNYQHYSARGRFSAKTKNDLYAKIANMYIDTPSLDCVEGEIIKGEVFVADFPKSKAVILPVDDPRCKEIIKRGEATGVYGDYYEVTFTRRGWKEFIYMIDEDRHYAEQGYNILSWLKAGR